MKQLKVLELFAGTRSIGKAFEAKGHRVVSVEWSKDFENIDEYCDIGTLTAEYLTEKYGHFDVIWMSPDCTSFSIAAISHHRKKNEETGNLDAVSDYAKFCDTVDQHCLELIKQLNPTYWFIENPVGGMRKMIWMQDLPRYTVTYCFRGDTKIITKEGSIEIEKLVNKEATLLTSGGIWTKAVVHNYGKQRLVKIVLSRAKKKKEIYTTSNHKWLVNGKEIETNKLKLGSRLDYVKPQRVQCEIINEYVARGFVYGDGWILNNVLENGAYVMFCNDKHEMLPYFEGYGGKRWRDDIETCVTTKLCSLPINWKTTTPSIDDNPSKIFSWLAGYIASDGTVNNKTGQVTIASAKKENLEIVRTLSRIIGIDTYSIVEYWRKGYGLNETPLYQLTFMKTDIPKELILRKKHIEGFIKSGLPKHQARKWTVVSVEETDLIEDVYCAEVNETHTFALDDGVLTHNCQYGDTRMKPTDLWTNHSNPKFKPRCKNGDPCHVSAPRGSRTGTQGLKGSKERSIIPKELCKHIVEICEE